MSKKIAIMGSTGSIGTQALEIVRANPDVEVTALAAGSNIDLIEKQIREFRPRLAALWDEKKAQELSIRVKDMPVKILSGIEGLLEIAVDPETEAVLTAVVGMIGIRPTLAAIEVGKDILLANKETLVTAGHLIMPLAKEKGVKILPVDSEHSAIFQSMEGQDKSAIEKILLTCSGGPFRGRAKDTLKEMTVEDALKHPNWAMGKKITVDCSTLVNKGLEVMEAKWLFGVEYDDIQVVVHPQSIIHSMVQYQDGAVMAQLGLPDMKLPIQYAMFYPYRRPMQEKRLDFFELATMTFEAPDTNAFPGLALALKAGRRGGSLPTVFNAANEKAVAMFIAGEIKFLQIAELIEKCMDNHQVIDNPNVEQILASESECYDLIERVK